MEPRPDEDELSTVGEQVDPVQGFQEDIPTASELQPEDGYHPEQGGAKYTDPDPVDEDLLAEQEGLEGEEAAELREDDDSPQ